MRTTRMTRTVRRTQRRQLAILIASTSFTSIGIIDWLPAQEKLVQTPVSNLAKVPAVRSIGIKLINPAGTTKPISEPNPILLPAASPTFALPVPAAINAGSLDLAAPSLPSLPSPINREEVSNTPKSEPNSESAKRNISPPPALPTTSSTTPHTHGKVVVKLSSDSATSQPSVTASNAIDRKAHSAITTPLPQVGPPARMPSLVLSGASTKSTESQGVAVAVNHEPIRVSMNDDSAGFVQSRTRLPELVKTKAAQISTVTVAETSDISLPDKGDAEHLASSQVEDKPISNVASVPVQVDEATRSTKLGFIERIDLSKNAATTAKVVASSVGFVSPSTPPEPMKQVGDSRDNAIAIPAALPPSANRPAFDAKYALAQPSASIDLESQTATAIDIPGTIKSVAVQNELVCRALHNDRTVSFVGDQTGSTLVLIWTSQSKVPQLIRINVAQPWQKPTSTPGDIRDVRHVVAQAFPASRLDIVTNDDGTIEVRGTTDSEEQAVRVLELVRKLCLVPVKDKVRVGR